MAAAAPDHVLHFNTGPVVAKLDAIANPLRPQKLNPETRVGSRLRVGTQIVAARDGIANTTDYIRGNIAVTQKRVTKIGPDGDYVGKSIVIVRISIRPRRR